MSYQALARKWRPRCFEELVGQEHVVQALANALERQQLHHAYLLTGTRGVGKTTIARILAKSLNCEKGVTARPCGQCAACREIDGGRFVDLLELDAASNTGIDNMREILDNARYAPTAGRYKVYLIDEVHMLSKAAFNSMLKTLEEPPDHVKFVLATTDPQRIPVTVLSRCLQFNLKQLPAPLIRERLAAVLQAEEIVFEAEALALIARAAQGSMRDALSLLDQAIAYGGGRVEDSVTRAMLGAVDGEFVFRLLGALATGDAGTLMQEARLLAERNLSFDSTLQEMAGRLQEIALAQVVPEALEDTAAQRPQILDLAARMSAEEVQLAYQIVTHARHELPLAPDEYAGFTMALLRLLAFRPDEEGGGAPRPGGGTPARRLEAQVARGQASSAEPASISPSETLAARSVVAAAPVAPSINVFDGDWARLARGLPIAGMAQQLALNSELKSWDGRSVTLKIADEHRHLADKAYQEKLRVALDQFFGQRVQLLVEVAHGVADSAALRERREKTEQFARAKQDFETDPFVREVVEKLGGQVRSDSIRPLS
ncbi:MAG: DNA polymerase III subunit gamma/tau [Betaproteobacteria bacterium]|nr:DNA polymerase III subunit gamma/tau [Betaproteobacteria bacterium]